jgi:hypothetical protein
MLRTGARDARRTEIYLDGLMAAEEREALMPRWTWTWTRPCCCCLPPAGGFNRLILRSA